MRILVTGASGLLGLNLALEARKNHQVTGVDRCKLTGVPFDMVCADLQDDGAVEHTLDKAQPDWLIHCAALADLEACESDPERAKSLNAELPGRMAAACRERGIRMVHISTDAVFDGTRVGAYSEMDAPHPLSVYAATKLDGETSVLAANPLALVARVNFYGWSPTGKRSLAEFFFNNLSAGRHVDGFTDVLFCPAFVGDLADLILSMLGKGLLGLYHVVGAECLSKYAFGVVLARRFGLDESLITPALVNMSALTAQRSHNLNLSVQKLSTSLGQVIPEFSSGMERFYQQYLQDYPKKISQYAQT